MKIKIEAEPLRGLGRIGGLKASPDEVTQVLGFAPNRVDSPLKIGPCWTFYLDSIPCGIWRSQNDALSYGVGLGFFPPSVRKLQAHATEALERLFPGKVTP